MRSNTGVKRRINDRVSLKDVSAGSFLTLYYTYCINDMKLFTNRLFSSSVGCHLALASANPVL
jgi:hypothetical protein